MDRAVGSCVITVRRYVVPDQDLTWRFSRASGPGGQSVNTTDSRVELVFDLAGSDAFPPTVKERALRALGEQVRVTASEHRSQLRNRAAAIERMTELLTQATAPPPRKRRPTKPTKASQRRRLEQKKQRSETKRLRRTVD